MKKNKTYRSIEMGRGATYCNNRYTVYEHGVYPRTSVLAGRPSRKWLNEFETLAEAQAAYPDAEVWAGSSYQPFEPSYYSDDFWHMIEKIFLKNEKEFNSYRRKYWKNDNYTTYYIAKPQSFPCVAIQTYSPVGALGVIYDVSEYVYPSDFEDKSYWQI